MRPALAVFIALVQLTVACKRHGEDKKEPPRPAAKAGVKKSAVPEAPKRQPYRIPEFELKDSVIALARCELPCTREVARARKVLSHMTANERLAARDTILRIYKEGDARARLGAIRTLLAFNLSQDWVDLVGEWLLGEKDPKIRASLYFLVARLGGPRAVTMVRAGLEGEHDFVAFRGAAEAAYLLDLKEGSHLLEEAFARVEGRPLSVVWLLLMRLARTRDISQFLASCRDRGGEKGGRCARALALYRREEDLLLLLGYLEGRKLTDPYSVSALAVYAKEKWFDKHLPKVMEVCLSLARDPKLPRLTREAALGVVGELGGREALAQLLALSQDRVVGDAARRAQWRIRRRIGLPVLEPLAPVPEPSSATPVPSGGQGSSRTGSSTTNDASMNAPSK